MPEPRSTPPTASDAPTPLASAVPASSPTPGHGSGHAGEGSKAAAPGRRSTLLPILGLLLAGYGFLVLAQVLPHDAPIAGALSLALGVALLWKRIPQLAFSRRGVVAGLGAVIVVGLLAYNLWRGSGLGAVEWCMLAYGLGLVAASRHLGRGIGSTDVGTLVAWSFPLALAPMALFAAN